MLIIFLVDEKDLSERRQACGKPISGEGLEQSWDLQLLLAVLGQQHRVVLVQWNLRYFHHCC